MNVSEARVKVWIDTVKDEVAFWFHRRAVRFHDVEDVQQQALLMCVVAESRGAEVGGGLARIIARRRVFSQPARGAEYARRFHRKREHETIDADAFVDCDGAEVSIPDALITESHETRVVERLTLDALVREFFQAHPVMRDARVARTTMVQRRHQFVQFGRTRVAHSPRLAAHQ